MEVEVDIEYSDESISCDTDERSEYDLLCSSEKFNDNTPPDLKNTKLLNEMLTRMISLRDQKYSDEYIYNVLKYEYSHLCNDFYFVIEILKIDYNSDNSNISSSHAPSICQ